MRIFENIGPVESRRSRRKQTILGTKADDLLSQSRRSFEPKQTIFWAKTDDLTKADDPKKMFFDSKQTILVKADDLISFIFYISKQTIIVRI